MKHKCMQKLVNLNKLYSLVIKLYCANVNFLVQMTNVKDIITGRN